MMSTVCMFASTVADTSFMKMNLPDELLLQIFECLPQSDLLHSIPLVCRTWYRISHSSSLQRKLSVQSSIPSDALKLSLSARPNLRVLKCPGLEHALGALPSALSYCPNLICLDVGFCNLSSELTHDLVSSLPPTLLHLNVEGVKSVDINVISTLVVRCLKLEAANFSHCVAVCDVCVELIAKHLHHLQRLNLDGIPWLTNMALTYLAEGEAIRTGHLSSLWLDGYDVTSDGLTHFFSQLAYGSDLLKSEPHLATSTWQLPRVPFNALRVFWISFGDNLTDQVIKSISLMSSLESITIRKASNVSTVAWRQLFCPLIPRTVGCRVIQPLFQNLEHLDLSEGLTIDDSVVSCICQTCGSGLRTLLLNWCWDVTDVGLAKIVSSCPHLQHLSLVGNHLIEGLPLVEIPEKQVHLRIVNLTQCTSVRDSILLELASSNSHMYIFDYFGERVGSGLNDVCHYDLWRSMEKIPICEH